MMSANWELMRIKFTCYNNMFGIG